MSTDLLPQLGWLAALTAVSLLAVWVPLFRGLRVGLQARRATRLPERDKLVRALTGGARVAAPPLALEMAELVGRSLQDGEADSLPPDFVLDAAKQYVANEYELRYAGLVSMYANLLPPIGFIGTTSGMLVLFVSMHLADQSLELGALALALTSSIFALIGFALLEGLKIRLYGRLLQGMSAVLDASRTVLKAK